MYHVGLYTKNLIYTEKIGISFETQFGYMYWVTHIVLSTLKSELVPFHPPPPTPLKCLYHTQTHFLEESTNNNKQ